MRAGLGKPQMPMQAPMGAQPMPPGAIAYEGQGMSGMAPQAPMMPGRMPMRPGMMPMQGPQMNQYQQFMRQRMGLM